METVSLPTPDVQLPKPKNKLLLVLVIALGLSTLVLVGILLFKFLTKPKTILNQIPTPVVLPISIPTINPTANWITFKNNQYQFEIKYPNSWSPEKDTHIFEKGDLFSIVIVGESQKQNTEFYDGARLTIGIPIQTTQDVKSWVKDYYRPNNINGEPNTFSEETIGSLSFQKVYTCGLGCFTYYNTRFGQYIYQIMTFADGINKSIYEQTLTSILSTFKFISHEAIIPTLSSTSKTLNYKLPSGWETVIDKSNLFSIGYNPLTYTVSNLESRIDLSCKQTGCSFFVKVLPYDGGSKHEFIRKNINVSNLEALETDKTIETNYVINEKSGLFLYNMDLSGSCSIGMIIINNTKALLIESQSCNSQFVEEILSTFKFLD